MRWDGPRERSGLPAFLVLAGEQALVGLRGRPRNGDLEDAGETLQHIVAFAGFAPSQP